MKFQIVQVFLILHSLFSSEILSSSVSNQKIPHFHHVNASTLNRDSVFFRKVKPKNEFGSTMSVNDGINTLFRERFGKSLKNMLRKNQYDSLERRHYAKSGFIRTPIAKSGFIRTPIAKRSILSFNENKDESLVTEKTIFNSERSIDNVKVPGQMNTSTTYPSADESMTEIIKKNNTSTSVSLFQSKDRIVTENPQKHGTVSSTPNKISTVLASDLSSPVKNNVTGNAKTIPIYAKESNSSLNDQPSVGWKEMFLANESSSSSNDHLNIDWHAIIDLDALLHIPAVYYTEEVAFFNNSLDSKQFSNEMLYNLTENFNCTVHEYLDLNITCYNIDLYSVGEYLPNDTTILDISHCTQVKLLKPLFSHLKMLKNLTLSNNYHRYITKAFMGLENLEMLDLSNNNIIALLRAFQYIPKLKVLNLSNNLFITLNPVSNAVRYLENLQILILDHNVFVKFIRREDMHSLKACNITLLSLFNTTLSHIEQGSFSSLPNLKTLELSVNYMNEQALANITCDIAETVEILYFGQMLNIYAFPYDALNCLANTRVRKLFLSYNYLNRISEFPNLPYLQALYLDNCSLSEIDIYAFDNITNLQILDLSGNKFNSFPTALSKVKSLKKLRIDDQNTVGDFDFFMKDYALQNLTNLESFTLTRLKLVKLSRYHLFGLKRLRVMFLYLSGLLEIEDYAFETFESLQVLDLRANGIKTLSNFTLYGLNKLEQIYLTGNWITFSPSVCPFQFSSSLSVLLIRYNQIEAIPKGIFSNLHNLRLLALGRNKVIPWTERIFPPNMSLTHLDLSQNNIDYVSEMMLEEFHQVTMLLDLSKNPFNCSKCGMRKFQNFCRLTNLTLTLPESEDSVYKCINPEYLHSEDFFKADIPEDICPDIDSTILNTLSILLLCFFILLVISVSSLCYVFRWYIKYWIFHLKASVDRKNSFLQKDFAYDAFITYSSCDTDWVVGHLIPALENQEPCYKLCVHQRDFQVGRQITENILDAIEKSRSVILILTEGFIKSEWCMYELHLAQHKLFGDARDALILIKLKEIDRKLYTKNLSYIEKTRRCFAWTDSNIGQKLFWEQIRKELGQPGRNKNNLQSVST